MINFRCPKCGDWMSVPMSLQGETETCPNCGNVTVVPNPAKTTTPNSYQNTSPKQLTKPSMPSVLSIGLCLYITSIFLDILGGIISQPNNNISEEQMGFVLLVGCIGFLLIPADIIGVIMACLGRAWGAQLLIVTTIIGFCISFIGLLDDPSLWMHPLSLITLPMSLVSFILFISPSAWRFYEASAAYRRSL